MASVVVGFVSDNLLPTEFVSCLLSLLAQRADQIQNRVIQVNGFAGRLDIGRHIVANTFMDGTDADYLLMLDTDMVFEVKDYDRLVTGMEKANGDDCVISGLYARQDGSFCVFDLDDQFVPTPQETLQGKRWYEAAGFGLGFCMVPRNVFARIQKGSGDVDLPWFQMGEVEGVRVADDTSFCLRAMEAEVPLFVDMEIQVGHLKTVSMYPKVDPPALAAVEKKLIVPGQPDA
jgi:hypothetical protein